jgi:urea transporter
MEQTMARFDYLYTGLKLLGFYFGVQGVVTIIGVISTLIVANSQRAPMQSFGLAALAQPVVYVVIAYLFIVHTEDLLETCGERKEQTP